MITFECTCGAIVRAADHLAGKVGKCPRCGTVTQIPSPVDALTPPSQEASPASPPMVGDLPSYQSRLKQVAVAATRKLRPKLGMILCSAAGLVVGLIGGYFAGRAHLRHQIINQIQQAGEAMAEVLKAGPADVLSGDPSHLSPQSESLIQAEFVAARVLEYGYVMSFNLRNISGKHIKAAQGVIHIYDQFSQHVAGLKVDRHDPILVGQTVSEEGKWLGVDARTVKLLQSGQAKIRFETRRVIYGDGHQESF